jgi:CPA1 family monovalent cation:H+ antiporter
MYWVAEELHCSGVLAVVSGGLFMSARRLVFLNSASRVQGFSVWESFVFILNGIIFLIIGLDLPEIVDGLRAKGIPISTAINYGLLVTGVLMVSRIISSYVAMIATYIFRPGVAPRLGSRTRTFLLPLVLGWSGMRGVVSLAAALSIPMVLDNGKEFPQRNLILFVTFVAILLTLLIQGLTLPWLIKKSHVFDHLTNEEKEKAARKNMKHGLKRHVHQFLTNKFEKELNDHAGMESLLKLWEQRQRAAEGSLMGEKKKAVFLELLESQRQFLAELNKDPDISEEMIREQLYQIDLEEERLRMS